MMHLNTPKYEINACTWLNYTCGLNAVGLLHDTVQNSAGNVVIKAVAASASASAVATAIVVVVMIKVIKF